MKPMPTRVTADWMAQQWRDGSAHKMKLGSIRRCRSQVRAKFSTAISPTSSRRVASIKIAGDTRPGTVADLFEAYVPI